MIQSRSVIEFWQLALGLATRRQLINEAATFWLLIYFLGPFSNSGVNVDPESREKFRM